MQFLPPCPAMQLLPPCRHSDNEPLDTDNELDHPRGLGRAATGGGRAPDDPPSPGGAQPASHERPPPRETGGAPPLPRRRRSSADQCARHAAALRRGSAPAGRPLGDWPRQAEPARAEGGAALGSGLAARAGRRVCARRAGAFGSKLAAAGGALQVQRARLLELEQLLAERREEAQDIRQTILKREACLEELKLQQCEPVARALVSIEKAAPVASSSSSSSSSPGAPANTTLMIRNIPMAVTQSELLILMNRSGSANRYGFAYVPSDFHARTAKGHSSVHSCHPP
ncbi:unnamed protein product [Prorocentrum cordatum]|uniref:RRM domain-containing protein n=1 Tax=Prorocentrum cordatum TaxID=2364126 RepID=A0ABN9TWE8_9DINO|nr:unnamed protein product [Polarella glacialis]